MRQVLITFYGVGEIIKVPDFLNRVLSCDFGGCGCELWIEVGRRSSEGPEQYCSNYKTVLQTFNNIYLYAYFLKENIIAKQWKKKIVNGNVQKKNQLFAVYFFIYSYYFPLIIVFISYIYCNFIHRCIYRLFPKSICVFKNNKKQQKSGKNILFSPKDLSKS